MREMDAYMGQFPYFKLRCASSLRLFEVLAYFTISKSGKAFKELARAGEDEERLADPNQLLKQPHVVQILACLRMLGYDFSRDALNSHLLQVRTGEGKSVILGTCAVVLALLGFKIHGICYSEYLTARDYADFLKLFQAFKVQRYVSHGSVLGKEEAMTGQHEQLSKVGQTYHWFIVSQ